MCSWLWRLRDGSGRRLVLAAAAARSRRKGVADAQGRRRVHPRRSSWRVPQGASTSPAPRCGATASPPRGARAGSGGGLDRGPLFVRQGVAPCLLGVGESLRDEAGVALQLVLGAAPPAHPPVCRADPPNGCHAAATEPSGPGRRGPDSATVLDSGRLAQLGEHQLDKLGVTGSSPVAPTSRNPRKSGGFVFSGLRVSEALGLRWRDVDLKAGTLTVSGQLGASGERLDSTRTEASATTVELLPALALELRAHRSRQAGPNLALVHRDALVFTTARGKPQSRRNALRAVHTAGRQRRAQRGWPRTCRPPRPQAFARRRGARVRPLTRGGGDPRPTRLGARHRDDVCRGCRRPRDTLTRRLADAGYGS